MKSLPHIQKSHQSRPAKEVLLYHTLRPEDQPFSKNSAYKQKRWYPVIEHHGARPIQTQTSQETLLNLPTFVFTGCIMEDPLEFCILKKGDPILFPMIDSAECLAPEEEFLTTSLILFTQRSSRRKKVYFTDIDSQIYVYRMKDS
jgi:hypothetical protein